MKRVLCVLLAVALLLAVSATAATVTSAATVMYGDVTGDGKINNRDLGLFQKYLNGSNVAIDLEAADVYYDGKVNNRDLGFLQKYLNGTDVHLGPEEPVVPYAQLPAVGYDMDGRERVYIESISQDGYEVTLTLVNTSTQWMTEETSYAEYTCTDAEGNVLTLDNKYFGTLYLGMLEAGDRDTYTITLPEGTAKLEFGFCRINYWSQWQL